MTVLVARSQRDHHDRIDPHVRGRWLSDLVLGAQDGLVNTLGVVLGIAAAGATARITFAAGVAAGAAEAISMAAVAYTSSLARGELFLAERAREYRHLESAPEIEREEIRELYARKGFHGEALDRVVDTICASPEVWVAVMMTEEHGLQAVDRPSSLRSAVIVGGSSLFGAILPVLPFVVLEHTAAIAVAVAAGGVGLFVLGSYKAHVTATPRTRGGLALLAIGLASAVAGYGVGALLGGGP